MQKLGKMVSAAVAACLLLSVGVAAFATGTETAETELVNSVVEQEIDLNDQESELELDQESVLETEEDASEVESDELAEDASLPEEEVKDQGAENADADKTQEGDLEKEEEKGSLIAPMSVGDWTPPLLNSINVDATVSLPASIPLTFDIVEDGLGVSSITVMLFKDDGSYDSLYLMWDASDGNNAPLRTGTHTVSFDRAAYSASDIGTYTVYSVSLEDVAGNSSYFSYDYMADDGTLTYDADTTYTATSSGKTIVTASDVKMPARVTGMSIVQNPLALPGHLQLKLQLDEVLPTDGAYSSIYITVASEAEYMAGTSGTNLYLDKDSYVTLQNGEIILRYEVDTYTLASGRNYITELILSNANGVATYELNASGQYDEIRGTSYSGDATGATMAGQSSFEVTNAMDDTTAPVANSVELLTPEVESPGVLQYKVNLVEEHSGMRSISFTFERTMSDGETVTTTMFYSFVDAVKTGEYIVKLPLDSNLVAGTEYRLISISLSDLSGNFLSYNLNAGVYTSSANQFTAALDFTVKDVAAGDVFLILNDAGVVDTLKAMPEGSTAYITYSAKNSVAYAELFEAIAGKDITIQFQNDAVSWRFNGKNIAAGAGKDVDLWVTLESDSKGDSTVLNVNFFANTQLPGPAEIVFSHSYLLNNAGNGETFYITNQGGTFAGTLDSAGLFRYTTSNTSSLVISMVGSITGGGTGGGTSNGGSGSGSSTNAIAQTGDDTDAAPYVVLAVAALAMGALAITSKKRREA